MQCAHLNQISSSAEDDNSGVHRDILVVKLIKLILLNSGPAPCNIDISVYLITMTIEILTIKLVYNISFDPIQLVK